MAVVDPKRDIQDYLNISREEGSLLVTDTARSEEPQMLLTGDLLFVGDIGRPDLSGEEILDEQVKNLYHSLYVKLADYPDHFKMIII